MTDTTLFSPEDLAAGERLVARPWRFVKGVVALDGLPDDGWTEVAFAGRSNVGKSSLINALVRNGSLARTSNTPGRTRQINFFNLRETITLVDLPGYGHAKAPKTEIAAWTALIRAYLDNRAVLKCACLLIDARRGFMDSDLGALGHFEEHNVPCRVVLTKCDKMKAAPLAATRLEMLEILEGHPTCAPGIIETSSDKGTGIDILRATLAAACRA